MAGKPDLLVLLGSGATMPQIPGVGAVTELLRALELKGKDMQRPTLRIFDEIAKRAAAFTAKDGKPYPQPNFEDLLGIAEYFSNSSSRKTFTDLFQHNSLGDLSKEYEAGCYAVLNWISSACDTVQGNPLPLVRGLEELAKHFRLWIFSLNYDDVPEHSKQIEFFTGYKDAPGTGWADGNSRFLATHLYNGTNQFGRTDSHFHIQLHGSVLFGPDYRQFGVLPRFPDRQSARASWDWRHTYQPTSGGKQIPRLPMVTGYAKANATLGEPFGAYMGLFRRAAMLTPAWLILGYGGSDPHVNACLKSAMLQSVVVGHIKGFQHAVVVDYYDLQGPTRLDLGLDDPLGNALARKLFYPWAESDIYDTNSAQYLRECHWFQDQSFNRLSRRLSVCMDGTEWAMTSGMPDLITKLKKLSEPV